MRRTLLVALTALAACFSDPGPVGSVPSTATSPLDSTGLSKGDTDTSSATTGLTTTGLTTTDVTTGLTTTGTTGAITTGLTTTGTTGLTSDSGQPVCGDTLCDADEDCNTCAEDCGACPLGFPPGGLPDPACINDEGSGGPTCGNISGAYTSAAVNIGHYPFRIKPGVGTALHTCDDRTIEALAPGQGFAAQSTQNPGCSDNPQLRAPVAGFVFGYARGLGTSGWVPAEALEFVGYDGGECADGPGDSGWQPSHNPYDECKAMACTGTNTCADGNPINPKDPLNTLAECGGLGLNITRTLAAPYLTLHAAPGANATHYLHEGDQIKLLYNNNKGWLFLEVKLTTCPALTPISTRGWIQNKPEYFGP